MKKPSSPSLLHLTAASSLDELAADPSIFNSLDFEVQDAIYEQVVTLEARLRAKVLARQHSHRTTSDSDDLALIEEAAAILKTSQDSLYSKWGKLPFAFKDPIDGKIKFSRRAIERYILDRIGSRELT